MDRRGDGFPLFFKSNKYFEVICTDMSKKRINIEPINIVMIHFRALWSVFVPLKWSLVATICRALDDGAAILIPALRAFVSSLVRGKRLPLSEYKPPREGLVTILALVGSLEIRWA